jgi:phosphonate degradation associated HDIG domain protein
MNSLPDQQSTTEFVLELFRIHGASQYGREAVTQLQHALQAATFAEAEHVPSALICAALLHDIGHLLHDLPDDAPDKGIDDRHELLAAEWLQSRFLPDVVEPVKLHVAAKRYLCTIDPGYHSQLSRPSLISLELQGGPMNDFETREFEKNPYSNDAVRLRRWDDLAKVADFVTPPVEHFACHLAAACLSQGAGA